MTSQKTKKCPFNGTPAPLSHQGTNTFWLHHTTADHGLSLPSVKLQMTPTRLSSKEFRNDYDSNSKNPSACPPAWQCDSRGINGETTLKNNTCANTNALAFVPKTDHDNQNLNNTGSNLWLEDTTRHCVIEAGRPSDLDSIFLDPINTTLRKDRIATSSHRLNSVDDACGPTNVVHGSSNKTLTNRSIGKQESLSVLLPSQLDSTEDEFWNSLSKRTERIPTKVERSVSTANYSSPIAIESRIANDLANISSLNSLGSIEDFSEAIQRLPSRFKDTNTDDFGKPLPQEKMLSRLDGIDRSSVLMQQHPSTIDRGLFDTSLSFNAGIRGVVDGLDSRKRSPIISGLEMTGIDLVPVETTTMLKELAAERPEEVGSWLTHFMRSVSKDENDSRRESCNQKGHSFPLSCGLPINPTWNKGTPAANFRTAAGFGIDRHSSYPKVFRASHKEGPILSDWVNNKFLSPKNLQNDGAYRLGESKTILVHEILRGNWSWCTAWSPDGNKLAVATDNHHLAVVDTTSSSVWRVRHDCSVTTPLKQTTTQSIRSIAWGEDFIAIGGIGDAVSIIAPTEPYQILHTISPTGFVGSIAWLPGSDKLLIGSRSGQATIHAIWENYDVVKDFGFPSSQSVREINSKKLHTIERGKAWVNSVQFKPNENFFAIGDSHGVLAVYSFENSKMIKLTSIANFKLEDSILDIEWSWDGSYLYAGGEDFTITVISTHYWESVHKIRRDRWVQFISSSQSSSHLAVGGIKSEVSILEVKNGWENIINISLKGLVPLSASWHPDDQYLVLTGQDSSIIAIETSNARHVSGHFLRSSYAILSFAFSPNGRMVAIGNEIGVVSVFILSDTTFVCIYEMVVDCYGAISISWSPNASFVAVAAGNKVVVISRSEKLSISTPPNISGFFVAKVIRDIGPIYDVSIDPNSHYLAVSGIITRVLNAKFDFKNALEMENGGTTMANSWSHDGKWFAAIGKDHSLVIYDTAQTDLSRWKAIFTVKTEGAGFALAWGRSSLVGLQYCAYGGEDRKIHIVEIRTKERTWETVLAIPRDGEINSLDWNSDGLLAAAVSNGTVTILDLSYLQSGWAVNEMDYNWQRQALACFTEIRRNRGKHGMKTVKWIPSEEALNFLAIGGTDGEIEIIDLTKKCNCK